MAEDEALMLRALVDRVGCEQFHDQPDCARIALDAPTRVLSRWRRHCDPGLRAACAS